MNVARCASIDPRSAMLAALFFEGKDSLTYFLGNTFALAAWWVLTGAISGIVLAMIGGMVAFTLTGRTDVRKNAERIVGTIGGALVGMHGGEIVGRIDDYSGVLSMVYLWGFVGMCMAVFLGEPSLRRRRLRSEITDFDERQESAATSTLDSLSNTFSRMGSQANGIAGAIFGAISGMLYGALTGWALPLSRTDAFTDSGPMGMVTAASITWAVLGGFGGGVGGSRHGMHRGLVAMLFGLVAGSSFGGIVALLGIVVDDKVSGAINGAIGGAFFGSIAVSEFINDRYL